MDLVNLEMVLLVVQKELAGLDTIEEVKSWMKDDRFVTHIREELEEHDILYEETQLVNDRLDALDDLINALTKFEIEYKDMQVNKFKQLELLRYASDYALRAQGAITGKFISDTANIEEIDKSVETKECSHPPCGKVFIADPPSKMYCSEKCREKAKKWRKRHTNE